MKSVVSNRGVLSQGADERSAQPGRSAAVVVEIFQSAEQLLGHSCLRSEVLLPPLSRGPVGRRNREAVPAAAVVMAG